MQAWTKTNVVVFTMVASALSLCAAGLATDKSAPATAASADPRNAVAGDSTAASVQQLMAVLQTREDQLRNLAYSLRESLSVIDAKGSKSLKQHSDVELRHKEGKVLLHSRTFNDASPDRPSTDVLALWDGKVMRQAVAPSTPEQHPKGLISGAEPDRLRTIAYNHMLGLRVLAGITLDREQRKVVYDHSTLTQWLARMIRENVPLTIEVDPMDQALLVLRVPTFGDVQVFWFDTRRGHMLVRFECRVQGGTSGIERSDVVESRQIQGIWVPIKVVRVSSNSAGPEKTQWTYEVRDFQVGVVRDEELKLEFAEGTDVIDTTTTPWDAFRVSRTGTESLDLQKAVHGKPQEPDEPAAAQDQKREAPPADH